MWRGLTSGGLVLGVVASVGVLSLPSTADSPAAAPLVADDGTPMAFLSSNPPILAVNELVSLSAEGSFDSDGYLVAYDWSIENLDQTTGGPETFVTEEPFTTYQPAAYGRYRVSLTVVDNDGNRSLPVESEFTAVQVTFSQNPIQVPLNGTIVMQVSILPPNDLVGISIRPTGVALMGAQRVSGGVFDVTLFGLSEGSASLIIGTALVELAEVSIGVGGTALPEAVAATPTRTIAAGNLAVLDGSGSFDNDEVGGSPGILEYMWQLTNLSNPAQAPIVLPSTINEVTTVRLEQPGEYEATLIVLDNDSELSASTTSSAHCDITVVQVTFAPAALTVTEGDTAGLTATINPNTAAARVSFASSNGTIMTVAPGAVAASPASLTVLALVPGSTEARATVTNDLGTEICGSVAVAVSAFVPPSFTASPLNFLSNAASVILNADVSNLDAPLTAVLESSNPTVFGFGPNGNATVPVANGANALNARAGAAGTANLTLVVTRGAQTLRIAGPSVTVTNPVPPPPPPPPQDLVIEFSRPGPYKIGERITVTARAPNAAPGTRIRLRVPGLGTVIGPASGTVLRDRLNRDGNLAASARILGTQITARANFTVVAMDRINDPTRILQLSGRTTQAITFTGRTSPRGYESMITWSVVPSRGVESRVNADGTFTVRFSNTGVYFISGSIGSSEDTGIVVVRSGGRR